jgi:transcriptional regulator with XRE-family HTH domain
MVVSQEDRDLGLWIRQRRLERGLAQHVLAQRAGLSRRWLVDVENGHLQPKFADLLRLVEVLGADLTEVPGVRRSRVDPSPRKLATVLERMDPSKVMWRTTVAFDRDAALAQL